MNPFRKISLILALCLLLPAIAHAQTTMGNILASSSSCTTTNSCVSMTINANNTGASIQVTGTFDAILQFEATTDSGVWVAAVGFNTASGSTASSTTTTGLWQFGLAGLRQLRVRASTYNSGTANIFFAATSGGSLGSTGGSGGAVTNAGTFAVQSTVVDCGDVTQGCKADAKSTATDTTPITVVSILKQQSASLQSIAGGTATASVTDPCDGVAKTNKSFTITSNTTTVLVAASSSNKLYVCAFNLVTGLANNIAFVEDASGSCASPDAGIIGGTTTGGGWNFAANGGISMGSGNGSVAQTASTNVNVCLITSSNGPANGSMSYVLAP